MGVLSIYAAATPVNALVAPGPDVTKQIPIEFIVLPYE